MSKHNGGHQHMKEIIDGDHAASVKHREGSAKTGIGGLAPSNANGYEHGNREEEFKKGGHVKK